MVISSFQGAEGFRHAKRQSAGNAKNGRPPRRGNRGIAFGTKALEDTDSFGCMHDYMSEPYHFSPSQLS